MGSGTVLVEARLTGRSAIGYDIDPLAHLIACAKSNPLCDDGIVAAYDDIVHQVKNDLEQLASSTPPPDALTRAIPPAFPNRDYWFEKRVAETLALLLWHIDATPMPDECRAFFRVAFSSLILSKNSVANARDIIHSRHHHVDHPQIPDVMKRFDTRVRAMRKQMAEFRALCRENPALQTEARLGDARKLPLDDESVDLIFTSPPYATALDYPRAHFLAVAWLKDALGVSLDTYIAKASAYIGATRGNLGKGFEMDSRIAQFGKACSVVQQLAGQSVRQAKLTQRYFVDMNQALSEMVRVLKGNRHAVIVVCPSHIRKVQIPTHQVLVEMGQASGFRLKREYTRTINERRRLLPYMQGAFGQRMNTEYVLIFQKR